MSSRILMLVNQNLTLEFSVSKGLRQGYPLTPFLFNIVLEELCTMMREVIKKNLFSSFLVVEQNVLVNLLQYAHDKIFMGETTLTNVITI